MSCMTPVEPWSWHEIARIVAVSMLGLLVGTAATGQTVTVTDGSGRCQAGFLTSSFRDVVIQPLESPPFASGPVTASASGSTATAAYTFTNDSLLWEFDHARAGGTGTRASTASDHHPTSLHFFVDQDVWATISGSFNVTDTGAGDRVRFSAFVNEEVSQAILFGATLESRVTPNESFTLGEAGGDWTNNSIGSTTFQLQAGTVYEVGWGALLDDLRADAGDTGATATGFIRIAFDSDGDGVPNDEDVCPGFDDLLDADADGVPDGCDLCPLDPTNADVDGDGICDADDVCLGASNVDSDGDQVCDENDLCLGNDATGDTDGDGVCDAEDNCPNDPNPGQEDADGDQIGDVCETDGDADGVADDVDNCPDDFNPDQADNDFDGVGDVCDPDDDDDGICDGASAAEPICAEGPDNCPLVANPGQADTDGDGQGDACELDDDMDGVDDASDLCPGTPASVPVNAVGCSGEQAIALACADNDVCAFPNKGQYQSCVVQEVNTAVAAGLLTNKEAASIKRAAARTACSP